MGKRNRPVAPRSGSAAPLRQGAQDAIAQSLQLGLEHHRAGRLQQAEIVYREVLRRDPDNAEALHLLGRIALSAGHLDHAEGFIERASMLKPRSFVYHKSAAEVLRARGRRDEAIARYQRALKLDPASAEAHNNLGNLLDEAGQLDAAIRHLERAVALRPDLAEAHNNLGVCLDRSGLGPRAREHFQRAIALRPDYAEAIFNDAKALTGQGRLEDAKRVYEAGLRLQPGNADGRLGYGIAHLLGGELEQGWEHYEARPRNPGDAPYTDDTSRRWRGEPLEGRTLLLHAEQGFGDTIQFVRFVPQLAASGARIVLELQPPLVALLAGVPGVSGVIARGTPRPAFDWQCPLPSLPYVLALGLDRIAATAEVPYLHAEPARLERWRARLGGCRGLRIGLAWAGNPNHLNDLNRSLPFAVLRPLADIAGVSFVALQKGPALAQAEAGHGPRVLLPGDELGDFADTAAAIAQLDLVISVDTSVAHLAGALGKPAWVLLPFAPDWRWMLEREDSPWYPTMRLFRQSRPRDWAGVIERVGRELTALAAQSDV